MNKGKPAEQVKDKIKVGDRLIVTYRDKEYESKPMKFRVTYVMKYGSSISSLGIYANEDVGYNTLFRGDIVHRINGRFV